MLAAREDLNEELETQQCEVGGSSGEREHGQHGLAVGERVGQGGLIDGQHLLADGQSQLHGKELRGLPVNLEDGVQAAGERVEEPGLVDGVEGQRQHAAGDFVLGFSGIERVLDQGEQLLTSGGPGGDESFRAIGLGDVEEDLDQEVQAQGSDVRVKR